MVLNNLNCLSYGQVRKILFGLQTLKHQRAAAIFFFFLGQKNTKKNLQAAISNSVGPNSVTLKPGCHLRKSARIYALAIALVMVA
jgi:hypothetical protein